MATLTVIIIECKLEEPADLKMKMLEERCVYNDILAKRAEEEEQVRYLNKIFDNVFNRSKQWEIEKKG